MGGSVIEPASGGTARSVSTTSPLQSHTLAGAALRPTLAALGSGGSSDATLRAVGIGDRCLTWNRRLPTSMTDALWVEAERTGGAALPLRVAASIRPQSYGHLTYLLAAAADLGSSLRALVRYYPLIGDSTRHHLGITRGRARLSVELLGTRPACVERFAMAVVGCFARNHCPATIRTAALTQPADPRLVAAMSRTLGCPIEVEASWCGVEFDGAALSTPLASADPQLLGLLRDHATWVGEQGGALADRVEGMLLAQGPHASQSAAEIAAALGLSDRSLRRRLAAEGHSYRGVLDRVLQARARDLLGDHSVDEVARTLGYADSAAFRRAHRRWYGVPPRATAASRSR